MAIFGKIFGNKLIFGNDTDTENVQEYLTFDYRLSRYIFPKLLEIPKLLPERIGLTYTLNEVRYVFLVRCLSQPRRCNAENASVNGMWQCSFKLYVTVDVCG